MAQYTRDERQGQKRRDNMRMAGDALKGDLGEGEKLTSKQRKQVRADAGVTHMGPEGNQYFNKEGNISDMGEGSNPFQVSSLEDFDTTAYGAGASKGADRISRGDLQGLFKSTEDGGGGFGAEDLQSYVNNMKENGTKVSSIAQKFLDNKLGTDSGGGSGGGGGGGDDGGGGGGVDLSPPDDGPSNPVTPTPGTGDNGSITQVQDNDNIQDNSNNSGTINTNIDNSQHAMMGMGSSYGDTDDFMASFKKKYNFFE